MGYCANVIGGSLTIWEKDKDNALQACKDEYSKEYDTPVVSDNLEEVLRDEELRLRLDNNNISIVGILTEKYRFGVERMLKTIAPFIRKGDYLEFCDEDYKHFRLMFDGKTMKKVWAKLVWEEE